MYQPFLLQIIRNIDQNDSAKKNMLWVFPTLLSIDYFQQLLNREELHNNRFSCCTLHNMMSSDAKMAVLPKLFLLKELHAVTNLILNREVPFDQFYAWGTTILQDFNLIDSYLVNPSNLFSACIQQKKNETSLAVNHAILEHESVILHNLSTNPCSLSSLLEENLPLIYDAFTKKMIQQDYGYEGLIYREVLDGDLPEKLTRYDQVIFAGFNLLTPSEKKFIEKLSTIVPVTFFWDTDTYYIDNPINIAGYYLRKHRETEVFRKSFNIDTNTHFNDLNKKMVITEVSDTIAQIRVVIDMLQEKTDQGACKHPPHKMGIVISGTALFIPLLNALATLSIPLHFRFNYPIKATVVYLLVKKLIAIWEETAAVKYTDNTLILSNFTASLALLQPLVNEEIQTQISSILTYPPTHVSDLEKIKIGEFGLWLNEHKTGLLNFLEKILTFINEYFIESDGLLLSLNKAVIHHLLEIIPSLKVRYEENHSGLSLLNYLQESSIPFYQNNPTTGLYIVDIAASHNLNFENIFFLNMSEGNFPKVAPSNSFIPYHLRNSFGLPLEDKKLESLTAYGFYRLLQRAQNAYCLFTSRSESGAPNEMSRLLLQLFYDSKLKITSQKFSVHYLALPKPVISIQKNDQVMQLLARFLVTQTETSSSLTPSALISYLNCSLQFYFSYVLQIKQTVATKDQDITVQLGSLLHEIMERLYKPFVGMEIDAHIITQLKSKVKIEIQTVVSDVSTNVDHTVKNAMLLVSILENFVKRILALDDANVPFKLLGVELGKDKPLVTALRLDTERNVQLGGIIDRVDEKEDLIRIIDYKTGDSNHKISNITSLFDRAQIKENKAIFQMMFYAWLFNTLHRTEKQKKIMPYLMHVKALFVDLATSSICIQQPNGSKEYISIKDIREHVEEFEEGMLRLLSEIFNPLVAFTQTEEREKCVYCPYIGICQRE